MTRKEKIQAVIDAMSDDDLMAINNDYCGEVNGEDYIYPMIEFDIIARYDSPTEIAYSIFNGSFNPNHEYFAVNAYGNYESFWEVRDFDRINTDEIAEYIDENGKSFGYEPIEEILNNEEEK